MLFLGAIASAALCLNLVGSLIDPGPAFAVATVYVLLFASVAFLQHILIFKRIIFSPNVRYSPGTNWRGMVLVDGYPDIAI